MTQSDARLPRAIRPRHYDLALEPDLAAGRFTGRVRIDLDVTEASSRIVCNALDLAIDHAAVSDAHGRRTLAIELDAEREWMIATTDPPVAPGPAQLEVVFAGTLNDKLRGFYRSTFTDDDGHSHVLATTQFEATDARRAFPCWDEPDFKASYAISLAVPHGLLAVSNSPIESETALDANRRLVRFAPTMVMSTYLVAFVVGPLDATPPVVVDGTPVRVIARRDRLHLAQAALDIAQFSLRFLSEYFDRRYPGDKLDLVAIPDFAFGAMENLGCVTFRENALLIDPADATQHEMQRVVDVIAHEIAHMWFGDLVTMSWWNGIWLNEAFATFMETKTTDAYRPEWHRWTDFSLARTQAFEVDSLRSTRPIEFEVRSPADAEAMFDVLTYEKGGAVVRMLEQYLGEEPFRSGIRHYIATHAFGNTETRDLWDAIEERTGEPVRKMMESWIFQSGYPLVHSERTERGIGLRQERFGFDSAADSAPAWSVPLRVRVDTGGTPAEHRFLLDGPAGELALPDPTARVLTINADASGFYRSAGATEDLRSIAVAGPVGLSALERYMLVDDAHALCLAGRLDAIELFAVLQGFRHEVDLSVWERIVAVADSLWRTVHPAQRDAYEARVQQLVGPKYDQLAGLVIDDDRLAQLRAVLFSALGRLASDARVLTRAREMVVAGDAEPALSAAAIAVVAAHAGPADRQLLTERLRQAPSPQQEERYRNALADTPDPAAFATTLEMTLDGEIRTQDGPYLLARAMANRHHGFAAWEFVSNHWDQLNAGFPSNSIARMISGIVHLAEPDQAPAVDRFLAAHPVPQGQRAIDQHRERLTVNARFRSRERHRFSSWLTAH